MRAVKLYCRFMMLWMCVQIASLLLRLMMWSGMEEMIAANKRAKLVDDLYEQHGSAGITQWRKEREERRIAEEQRLVSEY